MSRWKLLAVGLLFGGCVCTTSVGQKKYACQTDADCVSGYVCIQSVCSLPSQIDAGADGGPCAAGTQLLTDPLNCGACGHVCPTPINAAAVCFDGGCGRGPCGAGFFDLDPGVFGCESTCTATSCTLGSGMVVPITAPPLPETGIVFQAFSSSSSYGASTQTSGQYNNNATLSEPTPPAIDGGVQQSNANFINVGGFGSALRSP